MEPDVSRVLLRLVERDEAPEATAVLGLDDKVRELAGDRVNDHPGHRAARPVAAKAGAPIVNVASAMQASFTRQDPTGY